MATGANHIMVIQLYAPRRVTVCPQCGSTDIILEENSGQLVCRSCGLVVEDTVFMEQLLYSEDEKPRFSRRGYARKILAARRIARLTERLGAGEVAKLVNELASIPIEDIDEILKRNSCLRRLVSRLNGSEKAAAIHVATMLMREEVYPLASELAGAYGITRSAARRIIKRVAVCLGQEKPVEQLARGAP